MYFNPDISVISISLFAAAAVALIYILVVYGGRLRIVDKRRQQCDILPDDSVGELPSVSVVVYTHEDVDMLSENLPLILEQDYPAPFEVIVANDGTANETDDLIKLLKAKYDNIYLTFAPDNSRNISRKKLTLTLGIKAAKGDVLVLTDASTRILSPYWLRQMVMPFAQSGIEVVLGYNSLNLAEGKWRGRLVAAFDYVADCVTWLSSAIKGHPYRGCGANMAMRRDVFYRSKGYASSLNLVHGHDDLYVNEITDGSNTVVQLASGTIGVEGPRVGIRKRMKLSRQAYAFTGRSLPKASRRLMAVGEWLMWAVPVLVAAGVYYAGGRNGMGWSIAAVLLLTEYIGVALMWRKTIKMLGGPAMFMSLPWLAAFRPLRNIKANLLCRRRSNTNYSWQ